MAELRQMVGTAPERLLLYQQVTVPGVIAEFPAHGGEPNSPRNQEGGRARDDSGADNVTHIHRQRVIDRQKGLRALIAWAANEELVIQTFSANSHSNQPAKPCMMSSRAMVNSAVHETNPGSPPASSYRPIVRVRPANEFISTTRFGFVAKNNA